MLQTDYAFALRRESAASAGENVGAPCRHCASGIESPALLTLPRHTTAASLASKTFNLLPSDASACLTRKCTKSAAHGASL